MIFTASTALPYAHLQRATAGLRAELRRQLAPGELADWTTLSVTGPVPAVDGLGRTWFEYHATVISQNIRFLHVGRVEDDGVPTARGGGVWHASSVKAVCESQAAADPP